MRLPKPLYESVPYFLVAVGSLFIVLVIRQYQYAPMLFTWLLGLFCIIAGLALIVIRFIARRSRPASADEE
jgi:tellurite resistance protein TehA-like permease